MRSSSRPSRTVLLCLLWLVAVGLGGPGCRRAVKPDLGPERTVEAGVPAEFGSAGEDAPAVTWDFGDGTPARTQARISHAYARAGTYTVRALDGTEEVGRVQLTVVPRPVLRAIPAEAPVALYLPRLAGTVVTLVDFYEQLVGPELARRQLEAAPFLPMVLQSARGDASAVDPEEGFGLFTLPAFDGTVALLGVTDGAAAMDAVLKEFEASGTTVRRQEDGSARIERGPGAPVTLFLDRGYLYLAIPDDEEEAAPGEPVKAQAVGLAGAEELRRQIAGFSGAGLSESPVLERLRGKVTEGSVYLFTTFPEREGSGFPGLMASLRVQEGRAELDGFMASDKPLMEGRRGPLPALLASAPMGPVAAAMLSVPPEELATWVFGAPGSPRRAEAVEGWRKEGIEVESLVGSVRGDVTLLAYFDAPAFYRNFLMNKRPEPRGAVLMEAGLTRAEPVVAALTKVFEGGGWNVERVQEKGVTRFRARVLEQPLVLTVAADRLSLQAGEALEARPKGDVGTAMRERFGGGAFGPSHLSLMVDLGRLRAELDAPTQVPGVPQAQLGAAKAFGGALLDQLTPFEHAFLDFAPEEGGARVRGRVVLRTR